MPLPAFRDDGWLPEGHHAATWEEITDALDGAAGGVRAAVLANLLRWRDAARSAVLSGRLLIDGSFVSTKLNPGDFDLVFVYDTPTKELMDRDAAAKLLTNYDYCKAEFGGDIFIFWEENVRRYPAFCDINMFDRVKVTGIPKGVAEALL